MYSCPPLHPWQLMNTPWPLFVTYSYWILLLIRFPYHFWTFQWSEWRWRPCRSGIFFYWPIELHKKESHLWWEEKSEATSFCQFSRAAWLIWLISAPSKIDLIDLCTFYSSKHPFPLIFTNANSVPLLLGSFVWAPLHNWIYGWPSGLLSCPE